MSDVLDSLFATIEQRKAELPEGSYTAELFRRGQPQITQKIGEEAVEVVVAALAEDDAQVLYEMADLLYHCLVLLAARGLTHHDLEVELARRFK